jgi:ribonuclease HII
MKYVVGIDEVGRGPLAGPVTVCVTLCEENIYEDLKRNKLLPKSGIDSKKLTSVEREKYEKVLKDLALEGKISFSINHISNKEIDNKGIVFCIKKALKYGLINLKVPTESFILLDGSLKAPKKFKNQKTIIRGDEKEKIIAWSSILAKVSRDGLMIKMAKKFPKYGLDIHKGYGTDRHKKAIKKYGISAFHRESFIKA